MLSLGGIDEKTVTSLFCTFSPRCAGYAASLPAVTKLSLADIELTDRHQSAVQRGLLESLQWIIEI
jgi:hypothetical protein